MSAGEGCAMLEGLALLPHHWQQLTTGSGISPEVITERGYRSIVGPEDIPLLKQHRFSREQWARQTPGLLMPSWTADGKNGLMVYRPDEPRPAKDGKPIKHEIPKNVGVRLDCPPRCRVMLADPTISLWVTEGLKKGDALATHGLCAIALLGVWNFKGKNPFGGTTLLTDFDNIAWNGRDVRIVFDNDLMTNPQVRRALDRLTVHLQRKGAHVTAVYLPQTDGKKIGVDDYLLSHTVQELEGLIEAPRPQPQPAAPLIELLDEAPKTLTRALTLINDHAYAITWLPTKTTVTETQGKDGEIVKLTVPKVTTEWRLFVVRDDGALLGDVSDPKVMPLSELGLTIALLDRPREDLLWRSKGVVAYKAGIRPDVKATFECVVMVYDHFIDFSRSLDEQPRMCRVSACFSFMTWFVDAFTVPPYLWANSPAPGSGKTKVGHCWVKTSYLGHLTSASGSFAALRDLADMGATILFDDAEALANPHADPDKQALVLAGNRKGVSIAVKEVGADGRWHTRWLNAYCPRGFTALRLPFQALKSRAVVIPLVASADSDRANRDPEDEHAWPIDQRQLRDDLWAAALSLQPEAAAVWAEMSKETSVVGRDWERWRALVAVARLLERHGVDGLEKDVREVMSAYHKETSDLQNHSRVALVLRGLLRLANLDSSDIRTLQDVSDISSEPLKITASQVVDSLKAIQSEGGEEAEDEEGEPGEEQSSKPWYHSSRSVGRLLSKLRLKETRDPSQKRERYRVTSAKDIFHLALAHHIVHIQHGASEPSDATEPRQSEMTQPLLSGKMSEMSANVQMSEEDREWSA
jgi:Domain of unknown function (DUF3854)